MRDLPTHARVEFVQALGVLPQFRARMCARQARLPVGQRLSCLFEAPPCRVQRPFRQAPHRAQPFRAVRHAALRRCGGRGRTFVRDVVGNGHVRLVAYPADQRYRAGEDATRDALVVEGPEVLEGAAAARQYQYVAIGACGGEA